MRSRTTQRYRKRQVVAGALMLTSMMDILTTILFFLLKNYSHVVTNFNMATDIKLPQSTAMIPPPDATLQLVVTKKAILLDERELVTFVNGDIPKADLYKGDGVTIVPLAQALQAHKKRSQEVEKRSDTHTFNGMVVLQADKTLPFSILKKVIYTAGITDFVNLKLAVLKKDA